MLIAKMLLKEMNGNDANGNVSERCQSYMLIAKMWLKEKNGNDANGNL